MSSRGMCGGNGVFSHTEVVSESKIVPEMLGFTIETAVGGAKVGGVRRRLRLSSDRSAIGKWNRRWLNALLHVKG